MNEMAMQISYDQTEELNCDECGNAYFEQVLYIRKIPALLTGTGKVGYQPLPLFRCTECKHINDEFQPRVVTDTEPGASNSPIAEA